ncbi:MAG: heme o synthase [Planctomycetota bacterium]|jgi:protoheme IX farnesyltransferase
MSTTSHSATRPLVSAARVLDHVELTKPRLTLMVLFAVMAGFVVGSAGPVSLLRLVVTLVGAWLCAGGAHALNQLMERDTDALMRRTERRPLPSGRVLPGEALVTGAALAAVGVLWLSFTVGLPAASLAAATLLSYVFLYTPLKRRSSLNTLVGAVAGATPVLIGHAAASGGVGAGGWFLFSVVFLWQVPHFLAIAWMHREDYARAGCPMLPVLDETGEVTGRQVVLHSAALGLVSMVPVLRGTTGNLYLVGAAAVGLLLVACGVHFLSRRTRVRARVVFVASLAHLPILMFLYVVDRPVAQIWIP